MYKIYAALAGALALAASPTYADEDAGLYAGVGLGDFSTEVDNPDDLDDVDLDFDEDEDASKFFAGWRFNPFVAVQLDYIDFGESQTAVNLLDVRTDTKGTGANVVGTLPLGPIELYAKAGMLYYDVSIDVDGAEVLDDSGNDPYYGVGLGIVVLNKLSLRLEYEQIDIEQFDEADAVWLTAGWRF